MIGQSVAQTNTFSSGQLLHASYPDTIHFTGSFLREQFFAVGWQKRQTVALQTDYRDSTSD
jgi:hypothetical protein